MATKYFKNGMEVYNPNHADSAEVDDGNGGVTKVNGNPKPWQDQCWTGPGSDEQFGTPGDAAKAARRR
jgi:hypothetical protein